MNYLIVLLRYKVHIQCCLLSFSLNIISSVKIRLIRIVRITLFCKHLSIEKGIEKRVIGLSVYSCISITHICISMLSSMALEEAYFDRKL